MRRGLSVLFLVLIFISFTSAYTHLGDNVYLNLNGQDVNLQSSIAAGNFASLYFGSMYLGDIIFGHNANEIIVNVNGIIKTFDTALSDGSLISAVKGSSPISYPGYTLGYGEYASDVSITNRSGVVKSLQQAINDGEFYLGSEGTRANPFRISDCQGLENVSKNLIASYVLTKNIDCTGFSNFKTIANYSNYRKPTGSDGQIQLALFNLNSFNGEFNGNGFSIINLTVSSCKEPCTGFRCDGSQNPGSYSGLFAILGPSSYIHDVHLINLTNTAYCNTWVNHRGGIAGSLDHGDVHNCSVSGNIGSNHFAAVVGGLFGRMDGGFILRSYSSASVYANSGSNGDFDSVSVGGLVGYYGGSSNNDKINESYFAGSVIASSMGGAVSKGGFLGSKYVSAGLPIFTSYWDVNTSGVGSSGDNYYGATGKNTAEMKTQATYVGWNFGNIWAIDSNKNNGYPYLTSACVPSCVGKNCGSDGCGGSCGSCVIGKTCSAAGTCLLSNSPYGKYDPFSATPLSSDIPSTTCSYLSSGTVNEKKSRMATYLTSYKCSSNSDCASGNCASVTTSPSYISGVKICCPSGHVGCASNTIFAPALYEPGYCSNLYCVTPSCAFQYDNSGTW